MALKTKLTLLLIAGWLAMFLPSCGRLACAASYRTANFVVEASTPALAKKIGETAESFRKQHAIEWLGEAMPNWSRPCPIVAECSPNLGAGGQTSFVFDKGEVFNWDMKIQGNEERLLDSVVPHEVLHTVFASHFRCPLPRWADEGACTTVECQSERDKQSTLLFRFLKTGHGIAFDKMFAMKEYPPDILPLYSQGYSLSAYLLEHGGKRKFVEYLQAGIKSDNWPAETKQFYGFESLKSLQDTWLVSVQGGTKTVVLAAAESKAPATFADPASASYRVSILDAQHGNYSEWSSGSGTAIGPHAVLTNSHVVSHRVGGSAKLADSSGHVFDGKVAAVNRELECAVILTDATLPYVPLAGTDPAIGEPATFYGYAGGSLKQHPSAIVSNGKSHTTSGLPYIEVGTPSQMGDSGSGIFNVNGELTGIVWGCDGSQAMGVSIQHFVAKLPLFQQQCGPLGCSSCRSGNCPRPQTYTQPRPTQPPLVPLPQPPSLPPVVQQPNTDVAQLRKEISEVKDLLASFKPQAGPPGEPGAKGDIGERGPAGKDGQPCECDQAAIVAAVIKELDSRTKPESERSPSPAYFEIRPRK